jgi:hypothetical protein
MMSAIVHRVLTTLALVCATFTVSHGQVFLQYTLAPKQSYTYETTSSVTQSMSAMEQDVSSITTVTTKLHATVREAVVRQYTIDCSYDTLRIRLQAEGAEGMLPADSVMTLAGLADRKETITLSPRGTVLSTTSTGGDDMSATMSVVSGGGNGGVKALFPVFPGKELAVGETWTHETSDTMSRSQMPGSIQTKTTVKYTFDGTVDTLGYRCARIKVNSTEMVMTGTMQAMGMDMFIEGDGDLTGVMYVELSTGMQVIARTTTAMSTRMSMTGQGQAIVPITTETTTTLRRLQ